MTVADLSAGPDPVPWVEGERGQGIGEAEAQSHLGGSGWDGSEWQAPHSVVSLSECSIVACFHLFVYLLIILEICFY